MALDPRAAMLKINQERMDVQKGLAASQAEIGRKMTKKGRKGAWGKWLGQLAAPVLADWGTTALLNVVEVTTLLLSVNSILLLGCPEPDSLNVIVPGNNFSLNLALSGAIT